MYVQIGLLLVTFDNKFEVLSMGITTHLEVHGVGVQSLVLLMIVVIATGSACDGFHTALT
jgi:hypothetical protein